MKDPQNLRVNSEDSQEELPESKEPAEKKAVKKDPQQKRLEKKEQHIKRVKRTLIACIMGFFAGGLSFLLGGVPDATGIQPNTFLAVLLLMAGIVFQKHIFMLIGIDLTELGKKDWFYQGFMTFALWLITWTILLTTSIL
ncbi:hypothetical protein RJ53_02280 [Methanocalculus chunghsingensis]|uniref:Uncharacterized protein n=1 Tax=Methanocalculus chunghsingensis TaxID=156457 RepID=A0A8J7W8L2_9EURY|nr:hypothetical protein [Methanocalculus chunghsingensis]MBR1368387.1 hypothetical protein [Methanocalculus chunghsingensis]